MIHNRAARVFDAVALIDRDPAKASAWALTIIADCLVEMVEQNRGVGVFRDCLLAVLKEHKP